MSAKKYGLGDNSLAKLSPKNILFFILKKSSQFFRNRELFDCQNNVGQQMHAIFYLFAHDKEKLEKNLKKGVPAKKNYIYPEGQNEVFLSCDKKRNLYFFPK
jgi:hypothetical protein